MTHQGSLLNEQSAQPYTLNPKPERLLNEQTLRPARPPPPPAQPACLVGAADPIARVQARIRVPCAPLLAGSRCMATGVCRIHASGSQGRKRRRILARAVAGRRQSIFHGRHDRPRGQVAGALGHCQGGICSREKFVITRSAFRSVVNTTHTTNVANMLFPVVTPT